MLANVPPREDYQHSRTGRVDPGEDLWPPGRGQRRGLGIRWMGADSDLLGESARDASLLLNRVASPCAALSIDLVGKDGENRNKPICFQ